MRERSYAFLRLGDRWVNMAMITDIVDGGETLTVFLTSDMARMAGRDEVKLSPGLRPEPLAP